MIHDAYSKPPSLSSGFGAANILQAKSDQQQSPPHALQSGLRVPARAAFAMPLRHGKGQQRPENDDVQRHSVVLANVSGAQDCTRLSMVELVVVYYCNLRLAGSCVRNWGNYHN